MALFQPDEIGTLVDAATAKGVADNAPLDAEKTAVAKLINTAANTGLYQVLCNAELSEALISALEGMSYTVTRVPAKYSSSPQFQYIISWEA